MVKDRSLLWARIFFSIAFFCLFPVEYKPQPSSQRHNAIGISNMTIIGLRFAIARIINDLIIKVCYYAGIYVDILRLIYYDLSNMT